jgi:hypothetical protein
MLFLAERGDAEVFVYTGPGGESPPQNVIRARVDPSVTSIPARAFYGRKKLADVELCEGLVEIGNRSFIVCDHSIMKINIPTSLRRICDQAFNRSLRTHIFLHDGIESIGDQAFAGCIFTNFRAPSLITLIPSGMLFNCYSLFSMELPEIISEVYEWVFLDCFSLQMWPFHPMLLSAKKSLIDKVQPNSTICCCYLVQ